MNSQHLGVASGFLVMALAHTMVFAQLIAPPLGNLPGQNLPGQQGGNQNQGQGGGGGFPGGPVGGGAVGGQQGNNNTNTNAVVSLTRPKGVATFTPGYSLLNTRVMSTPRYQKGVTTDPVVLGQGVVQGAPRGFITVSTNSQGGLGGVASWGSNFQGGPGVAQPGPGVAQPGPGVAQPGPGVAQPRPGGGQLGGGFPGGGAGGGQPGQGGMGGMGQMGGIGQNPGQGGMGQLGGSRNPVGGFPGVVMFSLRNPVTDSAANPASPAPRASYAEQRLRLRLQQAPTQ